MALITAPKTNYSSLQIGLHWATALLIAANYFISDGMGDALDAHIEGAAVPGWTPVWHVWAGTTLLALVVLRLIVRWASGAPDAAKPGVAGRQGGALGAVCHDAGGADAGGGRVVLWH